MPTYGTTDRLTGGTATADGGTPANAVDNDEGTRWEIAADAPHWFNYDFGAGVTWAISKLRLFSASNRSPNAFNVTGSNNDSVYTTLYSGNSTNDDSWHEFTWENRVKYRYIKINVTSQFSALGLWIWEFQAFEGIYPTGGLGFGNPMIF